MTRDTLHDETIEIVEPPVEAPLGPRIRWAGIVWGMFLGAVAAAALWIVGSGDRRDAAAEWIGMLSVPTLVGAGVLAVGTILLIAGLVGLLRRAQKSLTRTTPRETEHPRQNTP